MNRKTQKCIKYSRSCVKHTDNNRIKNSHMKSSLKRQRILEVKIQYAYLKNYDKWLPMYMSF